jgi:hypothetical protein
MYDSYAASYTVPYVPNFQDAVQNNGSLQIHLGLNDTIPHTFTIDTGSTGIAVSSSFIKGFTRDNRQEGWVFYNSSGLLLRGYFNTIPVHFLDRQGLQVACHCAPDGSWIARMVARIPPMLVRVALANKMALIVWALLARGEVYRAPAA